MATDSSIDFDGFVHFHSALDGSMDLLLGFFEGGVFDRQRIAVLLQDSSRLTRSHRQRFDRAGIAYRVYGKTVAKPALDNAAVYYPFNGSGNIRMLSEQQARHVFVTHGESHKSASVNIRMRMYDYLVTAGQVGLDRYLNAGLFAPDDVAGGRLIRMGDTFVMSSGYARGAGGPQDWVLYAPTHEGANERANYCSLSSPDGLAHVAAYAEAIGLKRIVVQPHPNLGRRLSTYRTGLFAALEALARRGFEIAMPEQVRLPWRWQSLSRNWPFLQRGRPGQFNIRKAFVDVSGMEVQLLGDGIECAVFLKDVPQFVQGHPLLEPYYAQAGLLDWRAKPRAEAINAGLLREVTNYYLSYSDPALATMTRHERLDWLTRYVQDDPYWKRSRSQ